MVLGQRFKVLVLVPTAALVATLAVVGDIARTGAVWPTILFTLAVIVSLQIGYLLGIGIRYLLIGVRTRPPRGDSLSGTAPTRRPAH